MSDIKNNNRIKVQERKLLICFQHSKIKWYQIKRTKIIQNKPIKFGLSIKNIDDKPSPEITIKNLLLKSSEGGSIYNEYKEEFVIPKLNPKQEALLWWPYPISTVIRGQSWIKCDIVSSDASINIITFQQECGRHIRCERENQWGDALVIRGELEQQQARTNYYMLILTLLVFLDGVWGLSNISKGFLSFLSSILRNLSTFLGKISS